MSIKKNGNQALGRGRRGLSTKMHVAICKSCVVNCQLSPGQTQDFKAIESLWQKWPWQRIKAVVGDKGYDSAAIRNFIGSKKAKAVIPTKGMWVKEDQEPRPMKNTRLYAKRHIIERFFGRIKDNKRIATRFDKLDNSFLSFIA